MRSVLLIAGLDPCGGAGILADAAVVVSRGMRTVGVVTTLTEQDTAGLRAAHPVPSATVGDQLRAVLADVEVAAVKVGALGCEETAAVVADALDATTAPVVWDPVLRPTAGSVRLYEGDAAAAVGMLARHVTIATPNMAEAAQLAGHEVTALAEMKSAARAIQRAGLPAVLVTGGHLVDGPIDVLADSTRVIEFEGSRIAVEGEVHGTGCVLSSALACELAAGVEMVPAVCAAKQFVAGKLQHPRRPGRGMATIV